MSEIDSSSEIEQLMYPKDELNKKIVTLADTIRKWNDETTRVRKTVKEQFREILDLGLNKYNMDKTALRKLVIDIFLIHGVSDSYLRKLLPLELKDPSKTRISYLQKQEMERERQRLLQQQASKSQQTPETIRAGVSPNNELSWNQPAELELNQSSLEITEYGQEVHTPQDHEASALESYKKVIEKLEGEVQRLSKDFIARAILQAYTETFPLVVHIDPVKRIITRIEIDKDSGI